MYSALGEIKGSKILAEKEDTVNNDGVDLLTLSHTTSDGGNGQAGIGVGISFESENTDGNPVVVAKLEAVLSNANAGSEVGDFLLYTADGGSVDKIVTLNKQKLDLESTNAVYSIGGTTVLSKDTLGSTVLSSALTSVGSLSSLTVVGKVTVEGNEIEHTGDSDLSITSTSQKVSIENVIFDNGKVSAVTTLEASGVVQLTSETVSTSTESGALVVSGGVGIGGALNVKGNITSTNGVASSSDRRWKKHIRQLNNSCQLLKRVRGVYYNYRTGEYPEKSFPPEEQLGVIAQEVEKVFPSVVITNKDGFKSVQYGKISAILIAAANEQTRAIESLQRQADVLATTKKEPEPAFSPLDSLPKLRENRHGGVDAVYAIIVLIAILTLVLFPLTMIGFYEVFLRERVKRRDDIIVKPFPDRKK